MAGSLMEGVNIFKNIAGILEGIPFSVTLLLILGTHELGHYLSARKHSVDASLPYFIPAPTFIGTFGAFIRIRSPIQKRNALLEIGAAGPLAGFMVAVPALFIGLSQSKIVFPKELETGIRLGDSLLMKFATWITFPGLPENADILLSPVAFAAWIGLLVTALNLLPIGQLDGGHIAYAILGKKHERIAQLAFLALIPLGIFLSINWLVWAALIFFLIRIKHPPILDIQSSLDNRQLALGLFSLLIFILTFVPQPFQ
jgi:membrane-associated protease RseP (regulator of RpoE activity)